MTDRIDALERLSKLRADGVLSDEEFAAQKAALFADRAAPDSSIKSRWRDGREKSRGVRRFFRWFWLVQMAAVVLVGLYFLVRGQTSNEEMVNAVSVQTNVSGNSQAEVADAQYGDDHVVDKKEAITPLSEVAITDATLENPWNYDGDGGESSSTEVCANTTITLSNSSARALNLSVSNLNTADQVGVIGEMPPASTAPLNVGPEGQYVIGQVIEGGATGLYLLNAIPCGRP